MDERGKKIVEKKARTRQLFRQMFLDHQDKLTSEGIALMRDLGDFCYARKSLAKVSPKSGMIDPIAMGIAEGRREVFLYIVNMLNTDDAIFNRLLTQYYQEND